MKPPIFAIDGHDVLAFRTVASAEQYIEPEDVENEVYELFDSEGRRLAATSSISPRRVNLYPREAQPSHATELEEALRQFLKHIDVDPARLELATLEELINKMISSYTTG